MPPPPTHTPSTNHQVFQCGHYFCDACSQTALSQPRPTCPYCRKPISVGSVFRCKGGGGLVCAVSPALRLCRRMHTHTHAHTRTPCVLRTQALMHTPPEASSAPGHVVRHATSTSRPCRPSPAARGAASHSMTRVVGPGAPPPPVRRDHTRVSLSEASGVHDPEVNPPEGPAVRNVRVRARVRACVRACVRELQCVRPCVAWRGVLLGWCHQR
jgi:hypothetical protein